MQPHQRTTLIWLLSVPGSTWSPTARTAGHWQVAPEEAGCRPARRRPAAHARPPVELSGPSPRSRTALRASCSTADGACHASLQARHAAGCFDTALKFELLGVGRWGCLLILSNNLLATNIASHVILWMLAIAFSRVGVVFQHNSHALLCYYAPLLCSFRIIYIYVLLLLL